MKRRLAILLLLVLLAAVSWAAGEPEELQPGLYAEITTPRGTMVFELDYLNTPLTVANFAGLATGLLENSTVALGTPYYDGMTIYREARQYAVFIGDPSGDGTGGPGYTLPRETGGQISAAEPGVLVMDGFATESAGSRFFITVSGDPFLDSKYTSFGRIVTGNDVLRRLRLGDVIKSIRILEIGSQAEALTINQEVLQQLIAVARQAEIDHLRELNPDLGDAIIALGDTSQKTSSGIYHRTVQEGEGSSPELGDQVSMHYTGTLVNGTVFDSSQSRGQTYDFVLGRDSIIPGWFEMVADMKPGEARRVIIPPGLAYGERGYGPIEPDSWLIFDMELVSVIKE